MNDLIRGTIVREEESQRLIETTQTPKVGSVSEDVNKVILKLGNQWWQFKAVIQNHCILSKVEIEDLRFVNCDPSALKKNKNPAATCFS